MFNEADLEDSIRIPPNMFGEPINEVARKQLKTRYEGIIDDELGYVIAVTRIEVSYTGKIVPGDGATHNKVKFSLLTFYPKLQEINEGEIVEIADFGAFIRIGPIDALIHVSQIMDDFISYDDRQGVLMGKETKRKLNSGDHVRVRITAVSLGRSGGSGKIGVTARQPFLGKIEWIQKDVEKTSLDSENSGVAEASTGEKKI